jgi:hypothetical protein
VSVLADHLEERDIVRGRRFASAKAALFSGQRPEKAGVGRTECSHGAAMMSWCGAGNYGRPERYRWYEKRMNRNTSWNGEAYPAPRQGHVVLVVDNEAANRERVADYLTLNNFRVTRAENGKRMMEILQEEPVDLVALESMMRGEDGPTRDSGSIVVLSVDCGFHLNGLTIATPKGLKSSTLRVATVSSRTSAVAAISASSRWWSARRCINCPQRLKIAASTANTL